MTFRTTRRQALQLGMAAGMVSASGLAARGQEQGPCRGGTMRVAKGHGSTTDSLDPGMIEHGFMYANAFNYANFLTEVDANNDVVAELAESWEPSEDAATWTFHLRPGVKFHDGRTMTAGDVVASFNHHRGEGNTSAAAPLAATITDIRAEDENTVVFELESGNADFPFTVSDYHFAILPANDDGTLDWQSGIGTGPYKIDNFEPGVRVDYTRNEDYFKSDRAWFDGIELLVILDGTARVNALMTGEVDAIDKVPLEVAERLESTPDITVKQVSGNQHYTFVMDTRAEPFNDNDVRQALKYGIDRQELVDKILRGYGTVGNDHPIGPGQRFFNEELEQKTYDPEKAREYLEKAGLDGVTVDLHVADAAWEGAVDAAQLYSEKANDAGITVNVVREPGDGYWSNVWMNEPFSACYWGGRPTEDWMFSTVYAAGASWNDAFWEHERFNELLLEARAELDPDKRREMYYEMQEIVANEGGTIIPMFASYVFATSPKVRHGDLASNWDMDGERWGERWWFEC